MKIPKTGLALFVLMFLVSGRPYAEAGGAAAVSHHAKQQGRATISVTGEAEDFFSPDTVTVTVAAETTAKAAAEAVADNGKATEKVVRALKQLIGPVAGSSVETSSFSVMPVYEYDRARKESMLKGYRARHQITVKTGKTGAAGSIIDSAVENGAKEVQSVSFVLRNDREHCDGLLKKAVERAQKEAAFVASALGRRISGIKSVSPSCGREAPRPVYRQALAASETASVPGTSIEAGKIAMHASVAVVFYLDRE